MKPGPAFLSIRVQIRLMHRRGGPKKKPLPFIPSLLLSGSAKISLLLEGSDCHKVSGVRGETLRVIIRSHHDLIPVCTSPLGVVSCQRDIWIPSTPPPTPNPAPHSLWTVVVWCFEENKITLKLKNKVVALSGGSMLCLCITKKKILQRNCFRTF